MNGFTLICCLAIVCCGVFVFFLLLHYKKSFSSILSRIQNARKDEALSGQTLDPEGKLKKTKTIETTYDPDMIDKAKEDYDKTYSKYVACSQLIPLFASLGLLGTVIGLILGSQSNIQMDKLLENLGLAMWTTASGLVCTIVLKIIDSIGPGRVVNSVDAALNRIDDQVNIEMYKMAGKNIQE